MTEEKKPIHVKPSYYALMFEPLKKIAFKYGYNLVLHGSLNRDLDLIAIPWVEELGNSSEMLDEFCSYLGGKLNMNCTQKKPHGRVAYIIEIYRQLVNVNNGFYRTSYEDDPQYYLDISIIFGRKTK